MISIFANILIKAQKNVLVLKGLNNVDHVVNNKFPCDDQNVTWASYHANQDKSTPTHCINAFHFLVTIRNQLP